MILRPRYTQRATQVLLVGPANSGKRTLADQLISSRETFISLGTDEELSATALDELGQVDFVLFLVDMTNKNSLLTLYRSFEHVAPEYLTNRCAVLMTKVDAVEAWTLDEEKVQRIINQYTPDIYTFRCNLSDRRERQKLGDQLARLVRISTLQQKNITMPLIKATTYYNHLPYSSRGTDETEYTEETDDDNSGMVSQAGQDDASGMVSEAEQDDTSRMPSDAEQDGDAKQDDRSRMLSETEQEDNQIQQEQAIQD
ncbi:hypothetical protein BDB00DRAFT_821564 [Zychaea mexicana]|uniref:uncharacterized protein n=1 Tax=Zychaea mexicana TaxID=64656 RepID=UPI0022FE4659|nr:uncharacterized protein BDB00DRAFT_821564 [Zychaea mexicana]KAI9493762.1 hypothetical protein BDB00DRAFT_821564 [Zychaea mexicana]